MEIDKGYESADSVFLFEAKVGKHQTFLTRQLYYPFRAHRDFQRTRDHKRVRPFFFVAEGETYSLWEFEWRGEDIEDYEAIRLRKKGRFRIVPAEVPKDWLTDITPNRSVPFFQANNLEMVLELPFLIRQGVNSKAAWGRHYDYNPRQGNYYRAAAEALGLVKNEDGTWTLTEDGRRYVSLRPDERDRFVVERLLEQPLLNAVFNLTNRRGAEGVGDSDIARAIQEVYDLSGNTPLRRASSVRSYFRWVSQATGTVVVEDRRIYSREAWEQRG
jgi:hypothetical protein